MDDNEWHDAPTIASTDEQKAEAEIIVKRSLSTENVALDAVDPWAEPGSKTNLASTSTSTSTRTFEFATEVVPLVFAGEAEILDSADAWGGSVEHHQTTAVGRTITPIQQEVGGPAPVLGEPRQTRVFWTSISGKYVPPDAIPIGRDSDGAPLFASRALYQGGVHVGKARNGSGCYIPFGGKEIELKDSEQYDVLCGITSGIEWVPANDKLTTSLVSTGRVIEGGRETSGDLLFIGVCDTYFHGSQVGKCGPHLAGLHYSYGGKEVRVSQYRVALHAAPSQEDVPTYEPVNPGSIYWRVASVKQGVPAGAIRMGRDSDGAPLYVGRAKVKNGGIQVGKVRLDTGCYIAFGGNELQFKKDFEVLCGDANLINLVEMEGTIGLGKLADLKPIEAGHEENGMPLYISILEAFGSIQIGKCSPTLNGCHFSYGGKECVGPKYRMIVYY
ncbi:UNVERIFIED_CONTAM: hypothetical protein HDU68_008422 [Siphonaria sp. JEL0065]|nr:hypothetical protein HDU68_008422 [Siphonaria sp. JEL0065]